ncbi:MAG: hypothetical protein JNN04_11460 [Cyclobacteriaceae bacterium]|nr:hypothetical protein [Cyclobacteriaceae bacterium]
MESTLLSLTGAGFLLLTVVFYGLLYRELKAGIALTSWTADRQRTVARRYLVGVSAWAIFLLSVSATGFFTNFDTFPPRLVIVLIVPLVAIILVVRSSAVKELLQLVPARNIIRLQFFRVFVELLIWASFALDQLPVQMTFEGRNFDVLSGLFAPIVAYWLANHKTALYIYNYVALALLINIVTVAILSTPVPFRVFMNEPANLLVTKFPFVMLPGMLVPLAYGLHFLSLRQLGLVQNK